MHIYASSSKESINFMTIAHTESERQNERTKDQQASLFYQNMSLRNLLLFYVSLFQSLCCKWMEGT